MKAERVADIEWKDGGVPVATQFDDPYFSLDDGLAETRYVFLNGNALSSRFCPGFSIAELGFGTGLNMLATYLAWRDAGSAPGVTFTSFEAFPMSAEDIARALAHFPELTEITSEFLTFWQSGARQFSLDGFSVEVIIGDAREQVSAWNSAADAWFLDGFSPAKNPELWGPDLMKAVGEHTRENGSFATYTAAGFVRRGLDAAGFNVERIRGFGRKRHMCRGEKRE